MSWTIAVALLLTVALCIDARVGVDRRVTPAGNVVLTPSDDDREIQCVNQYLCIGNVNAACNAEHLRTEAVTNVVSLIGDVECAPPDIARTSINVWDVHWQDMSEAFSRANDVINAVRADGGRVLVHCAAGVSRSSSVVIYHLMREHALSYEQALATVKAVRHIVQPNHGFENQLRALENEAKREL